MSQTLSSLVDSVDMKAVLISSRFRKPKTSIFPYSLMGLMKQNKITPLNRKKCCLNKFSLFTAHQGEQEAAQKPCIPPEQINPVLLLTAVCQ